MSGIPKLQHAEPVLLDRDRLEQLVCEMGEPGAERIIGRALEELAVRLNRIDMAFEAGNFDKAVKGAQGVIGIADQIGMALVAKVATDVGIAAARMDHAAVAATVARLARVGDVSLMSVWDLQDMSY